MCKRTPIDLGRWIHRQTNRIGIDTAILIANQDIAGVLHREYIHNRSIADQYQRIAGDRVPFRRITAGRLEDERLTKADNMIRAGIRLAGIGTTVDHAEILGKRRAATQAVGVSKGHGIQSKLIRIEVVPYDVHTEKLQVPGAFAKGTQVLLMYTVICAVSRRMESANWQTDV